MSDLKAANALETPPPAVEPVPAATGIPPQDVPAGSGETSNDIEAYRLEREKLLAEPEPSAPEETPVVETPVVPVTPPADTPPAEGEIEVDDDPAGSTPPETKPTQYRFRPADGVEALAFQIRKTADKEGVPKTLEQALTEAKGILKKDIPAVSASQALELPGPDASYEDVIAYLRNAQPQTEQEIKDLDAYRRAKRKDAMSRDLNMDAVAELDDLKDHLDQQTTAIRGKAATAHQQQVAEFHKNSDASKVRAMELYPDTMNADHAIVAEMVRLDGVLKETNNPLYGAADKPFKLAQMAANNLGIAPGKKPVASPQPVAKTRPAQPPIASGGARTTQASAPSGQLEDRLNKISTPEELEAARRELMATPA